jgi:hypothetical protein
MHAYWNQLAANLHYRGKVLILVVNAKEWGGEVSAFTAKGSKFPFIY